MDDEDVLLEVGFLPPHLHYRSSTPTLSSPQSSSFASSSNPPSSPLPHKLPPPPRPPKQDQPPPIDFNDFEESISVNQTPRARNQTTSRLAQLDEVDELLTPPPLTPPPQHPTLLDDFNPFESTTPQPQQQQQATPRPAPKATKVDKGKGKQVEKGQEQEKEQEQEKIQEDEFMLDMETVTLLETLAIAEEQEDAEKQQETARIDAETTREERSVQRDRAYIKQTKLQLHSKTKYTRGVDLGYDNETGDILVEQPTMVSSWNHVYATPLERRLTWDEAKKIPRSTRIFFCAPTHQPQPFVLSVEAMQQLADAFASGLTRKTLAGYGGVVGAYLRWCDEQGVPLNLRFPAQPTILLAYLASLAGKRVDTISGHRSAINWWHTIHDVTVDLVPHRWRILRRGLALSQPRKNEKRSPIKVEHLLAAHDNLDLSQIDQLSTYIAALIGFQGMARMGHLLLENQKAMDEFCVTKGDVKFAGEEGGPETGVTIFLPYEKQFGKEGRTLWIVKTSNDPRLDLSTLLRRFLVTCNLPASSSLLSTPSRADATIPWHLSRSWFNKKWDDAIELANLDPIRGHSFRIGGANAYMDLDMDLEVIKMMGGWSSDAYFLYWRNIDRIAQKQLRAFANGDDEEHGPEPDEDETAEFPDLADDEAVEVVTSSKTTKKTKGGAAAKKAKTAK